MELKDVQKIQLEILKYFLDFCKENNLTYYALGGTALGAKRHDGIIPWDDDIDIGMPRRDYEFLCKNINSWSRKDIFLRNFKNDEEYRYYISRLMDKNYKIVESRNKKLEKYTYISIDIFPLDGFPKNKILRQIHIFRILVNRFLMSLAYLDTVDKNRERNVFERFLIKFFTTFSIKKFINASSRKYRIDKLLKKYSVEKSYYIGNIMGAYREREVVPRQWFGDGKFVKFEDIKINCPQQLETYLEHTYGDYNLLPSNQDILRKKHFEEYKNDEEILNAKKI